MNLVLNHLRTQLQSNKEIAKYYSANEYPDDIMKFRINEYIEQLELAIKIIEKQLINDQNNS